MTCPRSWSRSLSTLTVAERRQFLVIIEAAAAGVGVALLPQFMVVSELASGRLVPLSGPIESSDAYCLVVPNAEADDSLVEAFCHWLLSEVGAE